MQPTPLEHPRFRVFARASKKLVIFFSGSSTPDNEFRWWKVANRISASAILVSNGPNEWYQRGIDGLGSSVDDVAAVFRAWADHLGATQIYTVGTSMGGAGALLYGAKLDANVLAFAAETRLDYPRGNVQRLMVKGFTPPYPDLRPLLAASRGWVDLISGESEPVDLISAAHVANLPRVNVTTLKRVTHGPPNYLKTRNRLDPLIDAFIEGRPLPEFEEEGSAALIDGFPQALYAAYCADKDKRHGDAERHARLALDLYPSSEMALSLWGKAIMHQGRAQEALPILKMAVKAHPRADNRLLYATALGKTGRKADAVKALKTLIERYPDYADGYNALAGLYASVGSYKSAVARMKEAVKLAPNRTAFATRLAAFQVKVAATPAATLP